MVPGKRLALTLTDVLIGGYLAVVTVVILVRGPFHDGLHWLLVAHVLFAVLLGLFRRLAPTDRVGRLVHDFYPILLLGGLYSEIGTLNQATGLETILAHDAVVQRWEAALFGSQISYEWIRQAPSVLWSGVLHLSYVSYYPVIVLGGPLVALRGHRDAARQVVSAMMIGYVACYLVFILYPVAGPNYAFPHPTGPVREVWSARLVYGMLSGGSSVGAAFPSSHIAGTVAVTIATWRAWPRLGWVFGLIAAALLVAVVYCQMHYGVDALTGLAVGLLAGYICPPLWRWTSPAAAESGLMISSMSPRTSRR